MTNTELSARAKTTVETVSTAEVGKTVMGGDEWNPHLILCLNNVGQAEIYTADRHSSQQNEVIHGFDNVRNRHIVWYATAGQNCRIIPNVAEIENFAERVLPLLQDVHEGHTVEWSSFHNGYFGTLTREAEAAKAGVADMMADLDWCLSPVYEVTDSASGGDRVEIEAADEDEAYDIYCEDLDPADYNQGEPGVDNWITVKVFLNDELLYQADHEFD